MNKLKDIFETNKKPENINDQHFFKTVKDETQEIFKLLVSWEVAAKDFVERKSTKVFSPQITATKENIEVLILHSYYKDLRKRLYMERYHSVLYVLENLLEELVSTKER